MNYNSLNLALIVGFTMLTFSVVRAHIEPENEKTYTSERQVSKFTENFDIQSNDLEISTMSCTPRCLKGVWYCCWGSSDSQCSREGGSCSSN